VVEVGIAPVSKKTAVKIFLIHANLTMVFYAVVVFALGSEFLNKSI